MKFKPVYLIYPPWYAWVMHIGIAFSAAVYVILARQHNRLHFLSYPLFWLMLFISATLALLSMLIIEFTCSYLDNMLPWSNRKSHRVALRMLLQIVFGYEIPRIIILLSMQAVMQERFGPSGYMQSEYYMVAWMLIVYNILIIQLNKNHRLRRAYEVVQLRRKRKSKFLGQLEVIDRHILFLVPVNQMIMLCKKKGLSVVYMADGKSYGFNQTLDWLTDHLDPDRFCRINRWTIVNMDFVNGMDFTFNCKVVFRDGISNGFSSISPEVLEISDKYRKKFNRGYQEKVNRIPG